MHMQHQLAELAALTQRYLKQEYPDGGSVPCEPEAYALLKLTKAQPVTLTATPKQQPIFVQPTVTQQPIIPPVKPIEVISKPIAQPVPIQTTSIGPVSTSTEAKPFMTLETAIAPSTQDFGPMKAIFASIAPAITILDTIPEPKKTIASPKDAEILFLSFHEGPPFHTFLENISKAIDRKFASSVVVSALQIEKESGWEQLLHASKAKLIIAGDWSLYTFRELMKFYKDGGKGSNGLLHTIPLFVIPDLSLYLKQPKLKESLWKNLCDQIEKIS